MFLPVYGLAYNLAQVMVLLYGIHLVAAGRVTIGLLIGFLMYVNSFYLPLRQLATVWASFQLALAGLDRISAVLGLESNMPVDRARPAHARAAPSWRSSTSASATPAAARSCTTRRSRSSAARPTRSSARPAAARRRPPR